MQEIVRAPRFTLFLDESGDARYRHVDGTQHRYLCLCGVIIEQRGINPITAEMDVIKNRYFSQWPVQPVILTRSKIARRDDEFGVLHDPRIALKFDRDLFVFLESQPYTVIAVAIDKMEHQGKYQNPWEPYKYCFWGVLERYCGFLRWIGSRGDIIAERRGGTEDEQLKAAYTQAYHYGTNLRPANYFNVLTSHEIKIKRKSENIAGLQIADMLAHPAKQDILLACGKIEDQRRQLPLAICEMLVREKYHRKNSTGEIWSWGQYMLSA